MHTQVFNGKEGHSIKCLDLLIIIDCLLDEKVCNNKQKCNENKCRCECLEIK